MTSKIKYCICSASESCDRPLFENSRTQNNAVWYKIGDMLEYECWDGYENENGDTKGVIECGDNGWIHLPTCYGEY